VRAWADGRCARLTCIVLIFLLLVSTPERESFAADNKTPVLNVPIPVNHGAKGIKLPYFDEKGSLQMDFSIESAFRIDTDHLQMKGVKMQTYNENGKVEMLIDSSSSILDLTTRMVTSDEPITGETMQFDTQTKSGKIVGKVRMLIYNLTDMTEKGAK